MPLDLRIASFLAGIPIDPVGAALSNTEQGSTTSEHDNLDRSVATHVDQAPTPRGVHRSRGAGHATRKRRYRDERQKLSNSLAQKRYRERKKKAFDDMKSLLDTLTHELDGLQFLRRENERLTQEMEQYRQMADLQGAQRRPDQNRPAAEASSRNTLASECASTEQRDGAGQLLSNLPPTDWIGTLSQICQGRNSDQGGESSSLRDRLRLLEKEWNDRMTAVEHIIRLRHSCGFAAGASVEHMLPALRTCMSSMFTLSSDIANMKLQQLSQETQGNNERIQRAFLFLSNGE